MISESLNRYKGMEDQVGDFLKQLAAKIELVFLILIELCNDILQWFRSNSFRNFSSLSRRSNISIRRTLEKIHKCIFN